MFQGQESDQDTGLRGIRLPGTGFQFQLWEYTLGPRKSLRHQPAYYSQGNGHFLFFFPSARRTNLRILAKSLAFQQNLRFPVSSQHCPLDALTSSQGQLVKTIAGHMRNRGNRGQDNSLRNPCPGPGTPCPSRQQAPGPVTRPGRKEAPSIINMEEGHNSCKALKWLPALDLHAAVMRKM